MKEIYEAFDEIIELVRQSSPEKDACEEIVSRCTPAGTVEMQYCQPVEIAIQKYLSTALEAEKRDICNTLYADSPDPPDTDIQWIDFYLTDSLFEEVMHRAFEEKK